jgi:recombination protein RecA
VKIVKNKLAAPFREVEFEVLFGKGINTIGSLLDAALATGVLARSGAWILYNGRQLGQGRDAAVQAVAADRALAESIEAEVRDR